MGQTCARGQDDSLAVGRGHRCWGWPVGVGHRRHRLLGWGSSSGGSGFASPGRRRILIVAQINHIDDRVRVFGCNIEAFLMIYILSTQIEIMYPAGKMSLQRTPQVKTKTRSFVYCVAWDGKISSPLKAVKGLWHNVHLWVAIRNEVWTQPCFFFTR